MGVWEMISVDEADIALGILIAISTAVFSAIQFVRARRHRTSELYAEFYNSEHYRRVVMPVYRLMRRLRALPDGEREQYWQAVVAGWDRSPDPQVLYDALVPRAEDLPTTSEGLQQHSERELSAMHQHFFVESSTEMYTEHEALTAFLYFWVRAHRLAQTHLISQDLFAKLFCNSFAYYYEFLEELRTRVEDTFVSEPEVVQRQMPGWIESTRYIQGLLGPRD